MKEKTSIQLSLAKAFSVIFHPLLIPAYTVLLWFNMDIYISLLIPYQFKVFIFGIVIITTILFPGLFIMMMVRRKIIGSLQMETKEERIYPMAITAIFFFLCYYMLKQLQISSFFSLFFIGTSFLVIISLMITFFYKISIHMVGLGGMMGAFTGMSLLMGINAVNLIIIILFIAGITATSRLILKAHEPLQVYSGFILGTAVMMLIFLI